MQNLIELIHKIRQLLKLWKFHGSQYHWPTYLTHVQKNARKNIHFIFT
jgi:hypothetical protein